jgi:hypothetical protein
MSDVFEAMRQHFETVGIAAVRIQVTTGGFGPVVQPVAIEWLGQKEAELERLAADSQAEMAAAASRAATAAERAAIAAEAQARSAKHALITAIAATIIAAIALAVSILGVLHFLG